VNYPEVAPGVCVEWIYANSFPKKPLRLNVIFGVKCFATIVEDIVG
jgi:hypothetical protein